MFSAFQVGICFYYVSSGQSVTVVWKQFINGKLTHLICVKTNWVYINFK